MIKPFHSVRSLTFLAISSFILASLGLSSCKNKQSSHVEISSPRQLCAFDDNELQRPQTNSFSSIQPLSWRRVSMTSFRLLNYRAGKATEIAVGTASGSPKANIDRWYRQFKVTPLKDISKLSTPSVLGSTSYFVDLTGNFSTNMGGVAVAHDDWAIAGIITVLAKGEILTIKMTGPASEVAAEKENLLKFAQSLELATDAK